MADIPIDGVEIKCALSDDSVEPAVTSFDLDDPDRKRKIWFFDAIDLAAGKQCRDALLDDLARHGLTPDLAGKPKTEKVLKDLLLAPNHAW